MIFCLQNESSSLSFFPMTQIVNMSPEDAADKTAAKNDQNDTSTQNIITTTSITNSPAQNETLIKLPDPPPPPTPLPPPSNSPPTAIEPPPPPILEPICSDSSPNVDDGLTSLSWLQNLNMCMTRLGSTTPLTPPASPASQVCSSLGSFHHHHHHHHRYNHQNYHSHVHGSVRSASMKGLPISCKHSNHHPHHLSSSSPSSSVNGSSSSSSTSSSNTNGRSERSSRSAGHSSSSSSSTSSKNKRTLPRPEEMIDYKINGTDKPPYSYATLICMAMKANQNKMTLAAIYRWIKENFLYYKNAEPSWQNSIRHNLSLNKCFLKVSRTKEEPGKGGFWRLDPEYAETLVDGVFKKRRPSQRNNPTNGTILKRKSRKKDNQSDEISIDEKAQSSGQTDVIKITVHPMKSYEPLLIHDTPPSSAESCTFIENGGETTELVSAVNSIDNLSTTQCNEGPFSQYTIHIGNHSTYGEETGMALNEIGDASMVSTEVHNDESHHLFSQESGGDICWNAILTDADLELLSAASFPGRIVHATVNGSDLDTTVSSNQLTPISNPTDSGGGGDDGPGVNNTGSTLHLVDSPTGHVMEANSSSSLPSAASLFRQTDVVGSNSVANTNRNGSTSVIGGTVCSSGGGGGSMNRLLASNHATTTISTTIATGLVTSTTVSPVLNGRIPILTSGNNGICDIISANHNVVTCVNPDPSNVNNSTDWWTPFASLQHSLSDHSLASPDMISIQAVEGNHSDLMSSPIILAPVSASTSDANVNDGGRNNNSHNYAVNRSTSSLASCQSSFSSHHSNSIPNHGSRSQHDCIQIADGLMDSKIDNESNLFDPQSNLQPWIECKAALEAAAFDLEQFSVLENCADF
ncbi:uncharacterized protein LOC141855759 [Brevipalpus obovatus]|uniref:uncharacterized protein LOC141855759 n=1 Tax=Brevipalpus obovatus TaxID=246614 RepID=UPI003D9DF867